ncbi:DUF349 domain-containing protein [Rugamonas sp. CCM 8940]|uniref:DUF349 domain-containing protein n=1 Tax=Rugamonas sp. CCM 8940 TaxID=2765359 RepID=UPI0018F286E1|nr:DUF349 domain-containing protein [Rugamonas sp. CCM 8940]MBJ7309023.1 DUF349 domain-containing protein [Rugamonas sp. CCM 8940]
MFDFLFKRATDKSAEPQRATAASEASDAAVAQAASRRDEQTARAGMLAGDEAAAVELILQSEFAGVRLAAAEHVVSQPALEQVLLAMRNSDRRVAKLMQGRLDAIRYQHAEQQKAQACIAQAERLIQDEKLTPNMVADLDRQWSVTAAAAEQAERFAPLRVALAQRLETQVSLQRTVIDALAELRALPAAGLAPAAAAQTLERLRAGHASALASAELTSLPKHLLNDVAAALELAGTALQALEQHQAVFDARQAALAEWQAAAPDSLHAEQLRRAWQALGQVPAGELAARQQAELDVVLATVLAAKPPVAPAERNAKTREANPPHGANTAAATGAKPAKDGKQDNKRDGKQDNKQFIETLDAMEAALEQGLLHAASEHDKWLKEHKGGRLTPAQSERLAHVRAELKRLGDWARWGGNVSREELVKAVEELAAQGLAMSELAKKVGSMRERWKALDAVSGHAPKALWERFDAACSAAYAPAAAHFKQLAEERHHNAAKAQALIDEVSAMAGTEHADWKQVAAAAQRLRQVWGRLGTIDRKEKKKFDSAFDQAMNAMMAPLAEQRSLEMARREQLIAEVEALVPHDRGTLDVMRHLQERWQEQAKALPLERKAEQALWQRFRAACDHVFAQRKESAHAADSERKAHLHAREAICAGLETAAFDGADKAQLAAIAAALREAASAWHGAGAVPRATEAKITQRYQAAVAAVQAQADAIKRRAGAAQANALRDKLRLCQQLEVTLGQDGASADQAEWNGRWQALPPLAAEYERALHGRFNAALLALDGQRGRYAEQLEANRARLLDEVLRLEIVAGVDSGAEFARERLKMQVEVLQSSLKSGQKPLTQAAQYLQLCAMPALADDRTASRIEQLFRRIGAAEAS